MIVERWPDNLFLPNQVNVFNALKKSYMLEEFLIFLEILISMVEF